MFSAVVCRIAGHAIDRNRVWHDGISNRARCTRCRQPMIRGIEGWRQFDPVEDDAAGRELHPLTGEVA